MAELYAFRVFNLLIGVIGLAVGIGILLVPDTVLKIEKKLDREYSTEKLEKMLSKRKNLSESLMKRPKAFGSILLMISFLLLLSSLLF